MGEEFFVNVEDPAAIRKGLLETSKEAIKNLQNYEVFRSIRVQKVKYMAELKKIMEDVHDLNEQLKALLPATSFKKGAKEEVKQTKHNKKKKKGGKTRQNLDKLERELAAIESKLQTIS